MKRSSLVSHPSATGPRGHETRYSVRRRWRRGRLAIGAKSPFSSWTRSPASTPYSRLVTAHLRFRYADSMPASSKEAMSWRSCIRGVPGCDGIRRQRHRLCPPGQRRGGHHTTIAPWRRRPAGCSNLAEWLIAHGCTHVAMEATGRVLEARLACARRARCTLVLANAMHIRSVPGRKSDMNDATWIADLLAHGLIRSSFVPPAPIQELRDLTRTRRQLVHEVARHVLRIQKTLEDAQPQAHAGPEQHRRRQWPGDPAVR